MNREILKEEKDLIEKEVDKYNVITQYLNSPKILDYIDILKSSLHEIKEQLKQSILYRYLHAAEGVMLDDIAYLVGASRTLYGVPLSPWFGFYSLLNAKPAGSDDDPNIGGILRSDFDRDIEDKDIAFDQLLRNIILARVVKNYSQCTINDMYRYCLLILGSKRKLEIKEEKGYVVFKYEGTLSPEEKIIIGYLLGQFKTVGVPYKLQDGDGLVNITSINVWPEE